MPGDRRREAARTRCALQAFAREIVVWAAPYDAILTPALAEPPLHHGALDTCGPDPAEDVRALGAFTPYTASAT